MQRKPIARAVRRRVSRGRRRGRRSGRKFFMIMLLLLGFVLVYNFAGEEILYRFGFAATQGNVILADGEILVSFIDVGQGDSILVRSNDNAVLIDGGEHAQRNVVLDYLRNAGVRRLCYVVATHPHSDHIGGLVTVLGRLEIGYVIMPDVLHDTNTFERFLDAIENNNISVRIPVPGDRLQAGILDFLVIAPPNPHPGPARNLNNASIVLRLDHGSTSFLFTGDAERELEQWMIGSGMPLRANVLKIGHHGSRTSSIDAFLDAVDPSAAVITVGDGNIHGHPHREVLDRLNDRNIRIHRTDQMGTIRMITDGRDIHLHR